MVIFKWLLKEKKELGKFVSDNGIEEPLVSVVIPIYDRTDFLIESINSILNQSYKNFELLLICDGSPVETLNIVKSYEKHPKVRAFYFDDNSGNAVRGRNTAIKEAKGKYLAFQDSDDIAEKDRLKLSVEYIQKYNADIVYGGWRAIVDGTRDVKLKNGEVVYSSDCDYEMLKKKCVPCQSTVMASLEALRNVGGLKEIMKYREDHELWLRLAYNNYKFKSIPAILTNLRLHRGNLEIKFKDNDNYWYNLAIEEHRKSISQKPRIAYLIGGCGISGGLQVVCHHAKRLRARGYDVMLVSVNGCKKIDWFPNLDVPIINMYELPKNIDVMIATYWTTAYTMKKLKAERKFYFVQSNESEFFNKFHKNYSLALNSYKMDYEYITMAKWIQKWLKEEFNRDSYYVPNGIDRSIIHKVKPIVPKTEKVRVLIEGPASIPFKGVDDAFKVVENLDCEVWYVSSSGKPKAEWKYDKFFEKVPLEKMKDIYSSCDILLKMSRVDSFSLPILEMMACEGTCVVSKFQGCNEYIKDGFNALVIEQGDIEGARNALKRLIEDKELRNYLIANGKKTADEWEWERSIDKLEEIFLDKE